MDSERISQVVKQIYSLVSELEVMFPGRHFTPDGHMLGSIGEVLVADYYDLELVTASTKGYDALKDGKRIEIKATQRSRVAFRSSPDYVLVVKINDDGSFDEVYNGPGSLIWAQFSGKRLPSNGQFQIGLAKLKKLDSLVSPHTRIQPRSFL